MESFSIKASSALTAGETGIKMKLNLGCGNDIRKGWVNVDINPICKAVIKADLNKPLPFADESADYIFIKDVYEHLTNRESFIKEIHRILKPYGVIHWLQASYTNTIAWGDPDHKTAVSYFFFSEHLPRYGFKIIKTNWCWLSWLLECCGLLSHYEVKLMKEVERNEP